MRAFKYVEKPTKILSIHINELFFIGLSTIGAIVLVGIAGKFVDLPAKINLIIFLFAVGLFILLKRTNKKNHPSFIISYLSYHFFLPSKIEIKKGARIPVKQRYKND